MSSLPPALRPWATQLGLFPEDLALTLGPHVARLAAAIGSLRPRGEADGGEPQGYDGLTRRGPFERLLLSEWLYALESPDEFVRRAAFGEQAFLKPAFKQPQGSRRTVVLLDAGPDQLGAPRIAHLALLVVLQRRAEAAGAEFTWGVLQNPPDKGAFNSVTPATVQTWLNARSVVPARGEHVARWREALAIGSAPEDGWLVGDARLARFPESTGLSRVEVSEVMAPGVRKLAVAVRRVARAPASVELELPPPAECVRLLRDPFTSRAMSPVRLARGARVQTFFFSADGTRLILIRADGGVAVQPIPHSPRATVPRPRRFHPPEGQVLVAAGWRRNGGLLALTRDDKTLWIHGARPGARTAVSRPRGIPYLGYEGLLPEPPQLNMAPGLATTYFSNGQERVVVRDSEGRLFLVDAQGPALLGSRVSAFAEVRSKPIFVTTPGEESSAEGVWLGVLEDPHQRHVPLGPGDGKAFFTQVYTMSHPEAGLVALRHQPGIWQVLLPEGNVQISVPIGTRVVGVGYVTTPNREPALMVLGPDRRSLMFHGPTGSQLIARSPEDVAQAVGSHGLPVIAWLTVKGELLVWSFQHNAALYRAAPEDGS